MSNAQRSRERGPRDLIEKDGRPLRKIAAAADISIDTVMAAKSDNRWPAQHRTRTALRRALGVEA